MTANINTRPLAHPMTCFVYCIFSRSFKLYGVNLIQLQWEIFTMAYWKTSQFQMQIDGVTKSGAFAMCQHLMCRCV